MDANSVRKAPDRPVARSVCEQGVTGHWLIVPIVFVAGGFPLSSPVERVQFKAHGRTNGRPQLHIVIFILAGAPACTHASPGAVCAGAVCSDVLPCSVSRHAHVAPW